MIGIIWTPDDKQCLWEAKQELNFIKQGYIRQGRQIVKVSSTSFECYNGDIWKIVITSYEAPRAKCNISYIHRQISGDFIEKVIEPTTLMLPYWGYNYYGTPAHYYPEDKEEDKADNELDNLRCPLCGNRFTSWVDETRLAPWHICCNNDNIDIGYTKVKDGIRLLKDFIGVPNLHIEHYDDKIQTLSIDGILLIDNENN